MARKIEARFRSRPHPSARSGRLRLRRTALRAHHLDGDDLGSDRVIFDPLDPLDHTIFNIPDPEGSGNNLCPVCGFPHFEEDVFGYHGGLIAWGICRSCGFEPGLDDCRPTWKPLGRQVVSITLANIRLYRARWIAEKMPWHRGGSTHPDQAQPRNHRTRRVLAILLMKAPWLR